MSSSAAKDRLAEARLYGILDLGYVASEKAVAVAASLLAGGVDVLQLRAKGVQQSEIEVIARALHPLCQKVEIPFVVNDYPEIAFSTGADGVHVGQDDGSLSEVRKVVGDEMIVGRSTHSPTQARDALQEGFDYIGFGPLFPTPTKKGRPGIGLENIAEVEAEVGAKIPMFCIGGIKPTNLDDVLEKGARRVVIVSALLQAKDVEVATRAVREELHNR